MRGPTVSVAKCRAIVEAVERRGVRVEGWPARGGEPDPDDPDVLLRTHVHASDYYALWASAMAVVSDPGFPLEVARAPVSDLGLVGLLVSTSETVGRALASGLRFQRLWMTDGLWLDVPAAAGTRGLAFRTEGARGDARSPGARASVEYAVAAMLGGMRALSGCMIRPTAVSFAHPAPARRQAHVDFFGVEPTFDGNVDALLLDESHLSLPVVTRNVAVAAYLERRCEALLEELDQSEREDDVVARLRRYLMNLVPERPPSRRLAARWLGMSERTLQRRLRERGTSFRAVLDEVRLTVAHVLLEQGQTVDTVATLTGFASPSAFHRAYRRWCGVTPGATRGQRGS
ncbi:MAG: AraC family transcriptional regulator ligand-binding domain-containing protein [Myxococcales bacterium]|nr:AraC family transcriptional regulator ligand-binding domain-containing protein [Myxococcales bacterium]